MKLTVLGGGGVRSVFLAKSLLSRARKLGINQIVFMDNNREKLRIYGGMAKKASEIIDPDVSFSLTTDPVEAVKNADFIITTLRVGEEKARILDEQIALKHGVLGQETTGAGGFAMAMRSIPVLLEYCKLVKQHAKPGALVFNFTNPSGLVTQALRDEGFDNVYGICDAPSEFIKQLAGLLGKRVEDVSVECFGLNHLSWFRSVKVNGEEKICHLIADPLVYSDTDEHVFEQELTQMFGMLFNEYLYFYYYREKAIENIRLSEKTRGETILEINEQMYRELVRINIEEEFDKAIKIYAKYHYQRNKSYMSIESQGSRKYMGETVPVIDLKGEDDGGYAGVALNFIEAVITGKETEMVLSVPNQGSMEGLRDTDVIEVTCRIDKNGAAPVKIGKIPDLQMALIHQVKLYERLAVQAIKEKDKETAVKALMVHPLVNSYSIARQLVADYLKAHKEYVGEWR